MIIPKEHGEGHERHSQYRETHEHLTKAERTERNKERAAERAAKKEPLEVAVHHTKAIVIGFLIAAAAIGIPEAVYWGAGYLNPGASWSPFYHAPAPPAPTPIAPAAFVHPDFTFGSVTLLPQNMYTYIVEQRNDTLAWVNTFSGAASGIPTSAVNPPVGASYTYTQGFMFFSGTDPGTLTNGALNDGRVHTFKESGAPLPSTGHTVVPVYEYRSVAAVATAYSMVNNTAYTFAANHPLKAKWVAASNLSIRVTTSQLDIDALAKWVPYWDAANESMHGVYITYTGNWTTAALGAKDIDVFADGIKITPTVVLGSTNLNYLLPGSLGKSGVTVNSYYTHAAIAANVAINSITEKCASGLTPTSGETL